jgi:hypothetical protein
VLVPSHGATETPTEWFPAMSVALAEGFPELSKTV